MSQISKKDSGFAIVEDDVSSFSRKVIVTARSIDFNSEVYQLRNIVNIKKVEDTKPNPDRLPLDFMLAFFLAGLIASSLLESTNRMISIVLVIISLIYMISQPIYITKYGILIETNSGREISIFTLIYAKREEIFFALSRAMNEFAEETLIIQNNNTETIENHFQDNSQNISAQEIKVEGDNAFNMGEMINNELNSLFNKKQKQLKKYLKQLNDVLVSDNLLDSTKEYIFQQLKPLIEVGKDIEKPDNKELAKKTIEELNTTISLLPTTSKLVEVWLTLSPKIIKLLDFS